MNLYNFYKGNLCPICKKDLIFNFDYSKVACVDYKCRFNNDEAFDEIWLTYISKNMS